MKIDFEKIKKFCPEHIENRYFKKYNAIECYHLKNPGIQCQEKNCPLSQVDKERLSQKA